MKDAEKPSAPDPALTDERIAHIVRHVARAFQAGLERQLSIHGVNFGFWSYLRVLWQDEGLSQRELSERVGLTGPTTHSVIRRMEAAGLVALRPVTPGKSRQAVFLTPRGRDLRGVLEALAEGVNRTALKGFAPEEETQLRGLLLKINDNLT